jgi:hypothetical protein
VIIESLSSELPNKIWWFLKFFKNEAIINITYSRPQRAHGEPIGLSFRDVYVKRGLQLPYELVKEMSLSQFGKKFFEPSIIGRNSIARALNALDGIINLNKTVQ